MANKDLVRRIIEISFKNRLGHLGSSFSVLDILDSIYKIRQEDEVVILSNGHAGMALYVILEKYRGADAEKLYLKHGVHPNRDIENGIYVSTGSLGQGLPMAVGMALADRSKNVYCTLSDGECAEGSIWEAFRIASEQRLSNLKVVINANGYAGYKEIDVNTLPSKFRAFGCEVIHVNGHNSMALKKALLIKKNAAKPLAVFAKTTSEYFSFLKGQDAHYKVMEEEDYRTALKELS